MAEEKTLEQLNIETFLDGVAKVMERGYTIINWTYMEGGLVPVFIKPVQIPISGRLKINRGGGHRTESDLERAIA